ncbi:MAG: VWA domain-containing protein [Desulfovibrio sp.]|nr:VWA domain-containing protein [Desulfovibrio sp.]
MRRLPVYFLMDISDSMVGEPIQAVEKGIASMVEELRSDPYALETVFVSALGFAGKAVELAPLTDICLFEPPRLPIGSGTSLGEGLNLLMARIDSEVRKATASQKGDWRPIVFLFTDGAPTDNPDAAVKKWRDNYRKNANMIAVTFGKNADVALLRQLTDDVLTLTDLSAESFLEFFRWVSASMKASSAAVCDQGQAGPRLTDHCINLEKAGPGGAIDENFAILPLKCSRSGQFWLAKYARGQNNDWLLAGAWPVDEDSYRHLGGDGKAGSLDLGDADMMPDCPVCGQTEGVAKCSCGNLSCYPESEATACPWCGEEFGRLQEVDSMAADRSRG